MSATEHRRDMATLMGKVAVDLGEMLAYWTENSLPADFLSGAEYPFSESLDEVLSNVQRAADLLSGRES